MSRSSVFNRVGGLRPKRNVFDLSYRKNFTCDLGQLIPVVCDEVVPGDHVKLGNEIVIRFQPLAAPVMHEFSCSVHYFFVPYRILWEDWEDFISQGTLQPDGTLPIPLPRHNWNPSVDNTIGSLWDYFGFPMFNATGSTTPSQPGVSVLDFPFRAYARVYNEYYRDENLQAEIGDGIVEDANGNLLPINDKIVNRNWKKDYFTASLPFQQKGTAPALPVNVDFGGFADIVLNSGVTSVRAPVNYYDQNLNGSPSVATVITPASSGSVLNVYANSAPAQSSGVFGASLTNSVPGNFVADPSNLSAVTNTFDVSDLRLAFQTQKWLERNARGGSERYTEFLQSHFGVSPSDARLQRPEYIGGTKMPIVISEILQTSETTSDSPQGAMTGHGVAADGQFAGSYNVQEYGVIIAMMSVMPKPTYQDGINRQWLRTLPTDFYFPEFAHLSEQSVLEAEIQFGFGYQRTLSDGTVIKDDTPFGFIGQYDEMRIKHDMVCSEMRLLYDVSDNPTNTQFQLSYWNLARKFGLTSPPVLNSEFITCDPDKRIFLVEDKPGLIVNVHNLIKAVRPLPLIAEPGLIDHF